MSQTQLQGLCKATFPLADPGDISHIAPLQRLCGLQKGWKKMKFYGSMKYLAFGLQKCSKSNNHNS